MSKTTLPTSSQERKGIPLYSGPVRYFPAALRGVARICQVGNDKHNGPGTPLRHSRGLSMDHEDCILRHLVDLLEDHGAGVGRDENGVPQVDYIAWRAMALCQRWHEENDGAPLAPGATTDEHAPVSPPGATTDEHAPVSDFKFAFHPIHPSYRPL